MKNLEINWKEDVQDQHLRGQQQGCGSALEPTACLHSSCLWFLLPALPGLGFSADGICLSQLLPFPETSMYLLHYFHTQSGEGGESAQYFLSIVFYSRLPLLFLGQHREKLFLGLFSAFKILCTFVPQALRKAWALDATHTSPWEPSLRLFLCVIILMSRLGNHQVTLQAHS